MRKHMQSVPSLRHFRRIPPFLPPPIRHFAVTCDALPQIVMAALEAATQGRCSSV